MKNYYIYILLDGVRIFKNNNRWVSYNNHRQVNEKIVKGYNRRLK